LVRSRDRLQRAAHGIDGELRLVLDSRLTAAVEKKVWGTGTDAANEEIGGAPLRKAAIHLVDSQGKIVQSEELEHPLAKLERVRLYGDQRDTWLVTVDCSAGFGSYSGPVTELLEVRGGRMQWVERLDRATGKTGRISLMQSLKTVWQMVPASSGMGKDILEAACRPEGVDANDVKFKLNYARYTLAGNRWVRLAREEEGFSEFEDGFPDRKLFP
jgi:hypothetical protein